VPNVSSVLTTNRLRLSPLTSADLPGVHAIFADPTTWLHLPSGRHTTVLQTDRLLSESERSWAASGLGRWAVRLREPLLGTVLAADALIGLASATLMDCGARNLGYRFTPASWGAGLATEAAAAVLDVARVGVLPVTARALRGNPASVRVLERIGLTEVWSGNGGGDHGIHGDSYRDRDSDGDDRHPAQPDTANLGRVIFADRALSAHTLAALIALG
jgi:RimJ/RimL family protein N-acetyltransferase